MARCPLDDYQVKATDQVSEAELLVSEGSIAAETVEKPLLKINFSV
jgi:hypothetical protein